MLSMLSNVQSLFLQVCIQNLKIKICRILIMGVVLYGCQTWSFTLREERRLRVFHNRVLRRIPGPKRDEATGKWRILHNKEHHDLYSSPHIIWVIKSRRMRWAGHVLRTRTGEMHTGLWCGDISERDHLEDLDVERRVILKRDFKKWDSGMD